MSHIGMKHRRIKFERIRQLIGIFAQFIRKAMAYLCQKDDQLLVVLVISRRIELKDLGKRFIMPVLLQELDLRNKRKSMSLRNIETKTNNTNLFLIRNRITLDTVLQLRQIGGQTIVVSLTHDG